MDRLACVDLPAFPLQLLLRQHPDWRKHPAAVVDRDDPRGRILWVNEQARAARILPGMRTAAALSLTGHLRAAEMPVREIEQSVAHLIERLQHHTPRVEAATGEPGVFWLDGAGLARLQPSWRGWGDAIRSALQSEGFIVTVVVGFNRFGTYALARASHDALIVFPDLETETQAARTVPLDRLALPPATRDLLHRLDITTVGRFVDLPAEGIGKRFGAATLRLHRLATGTLQQPLQAERLPATARAHEILEPPVAAINRLLAVIERLLKTALEVVASRAAAATEIRLQFKFDRLGDHTETLRPAAPTRDTKQLLALVRLRLEGRQRLPDAVAEITLTARETPTTASQAGLFASRPRRDLDAANRALARVRAELGENTVVRARLRDGHLPEGSFTWEHLQTLTLPRPRNVTTGQLVRRIRHRPLALPPRPRQEPDGWMLRGLTEGPVVRISGPYIVAGGWWNRTVHREYHFAEVKRGDILWVYYDRIRRRWFIHGRVE